VKPRKTCSKNVRPRLRWLEYVEEDLWEMKFKCTTTHTEADSGKERVVHTHTAFLAERRFVSKSAPPVAIMSLSKMQRCLLQAENSYFK
jgi:hypothetical protein